METTTPTVSLLRQRMLDDMHKRKFAPKTQSSCLRAVRNLAAFLKASPGTARSEDLRRLQMHMVEPGTSPITLNATICGLKFFFEVALDRGQLTAKLQRVTVDGHLARAAWLPGAGHRRRRRHDDADLDQVDHESHLDPRHNSRGGPAPGSATAQ